MSACFIHFLISSKVGTAYVNIMIIHNIIRLILAIQYIQSPPLIGREAACGSPTPLVDQQPAFLQNFFPEIFNFGRILYSCIGSGVSVPSKSYARKVTLISFSKTICLSVFETPSGYVCKTCPVPSLWLVSPRDWWS